MRAPITLELISTSLKGRVPQNGSPLRSRVQCTSSRFPPHSRDQRPSRGSPLRSRPTLNSWRPACSSDRGIKFPDLPWVPQSKGKSSPRYSTDTARESSPVTVRTVRHNAAIPSAMRALHQHCADRPLSFQDTMSPAPVLPPLQAPRKGAGAPSKSVRAATKHMTRAALWHGIRGAHLIHHP
jgi:hypothetical protein